MLDSISDGLNGIRMNKNAVPKGTDLDGVIFRTWPVQWVDFSNANLQGGALYHADFKRTNFAGATLTTKLVSNVTLDGTNPSGSKTSRKANGGIPSGGKPNASPRSCCNTLSRTMLRPVRRTSGRRMQSPAKCCFRSCSAQARWRLGFVNLQPALHLPLFVLTASGSNDVPL